jgi:hypothetical protein
VKIGAAALERRLEHGRRVQSDLQLLANDTFLRAVGVAREAHHLAVHLRLRVEAETPVVAVAEHEIEQHERPHELRRVGGAAGREVQAPLEVTVLVGERHALWPRNPLDREPGRDVLLVL